MFQSAIVGGPTLLSRVLPAPIRRELRSAHRSICLSLSISAAKPLLKRHKPLPEALLQQLIYGWGNDGWSAKVELLQAILSERFGKDTSVLECGSGLSSILLSILSVQTGGRFVALEHDEIWHRLVGKKLSQFGLPVSAVAFTPLKAFKDYDWYDTSRFTDIAGKFDIILCDGPPSNTRGGRYGLVPCLVDRLRSGTRIIVDDYSRDDEINMISRWQDEYPGKFQITDKQSTFAILTVE